MIYFRKIPKKYFFRYFGNLYILELIKSCKYILSVIFCYFSIKTIILVFLFLNFSFKWDFRKYRNFNMPYLLIGWIFWLNFLFSDSDMSWSWKITHTLSFLFNLVFDICAHACPLCINDKKSQLLCQKNENRD